VGYRTSEDGGGEERSVTAVVLLEFHEDMYNTDTKKMKINNLHHRIQNFCPSDFGIAAFIHPKQHTLHHGTMRFSSFTWQCGQSFS